MVEHPVSTRIDARNDKPRLRLQKSLEPPLAPACKRGDTVSRFGLRLSDACIGYLAGESVRVGRDGFPFRRLLLVLDGLLLKLDSVFVFVGQVHAMFHPPHAAAHDCGEKEVGTGFKSEGFHFSSSGETSPWP